MNRITFSLEVFGERAAKAAFDSNGSNESYLEHLKKLLHKAIKEELTESQRDAVMGFYFQNLSVSEMAAARGVNKSTISRNLHRACQKLSLVMQYGASPIYLSQE